MSDQLFNQDRLKKRERLLKNGLVPYADTFERTHTAAQAKLETENKPTKVAGRIRSVRTMGKIIFCTLEDISGTVQIVLRQDDLGDTIFARFNELVDESDFIGVSGSAYVTKRGEHSVLASAFIMLSKALNGVPSNWYGISDVETRHRKRYLELATNPKERDAFRLRSGIIRALREFYWQNGFIEVETPTLQRKATGAVAKPYITKHNATDLEFALRISHELPLKTLMVAGYERIFELGKAFRNEGVDPSHLPEHTHIEHYAAYWDYRDNMDFTERMFAHVLKTVGVGQHLTLEDGTKINLKPTWKRVEFVGLFKKVTKLDLLKVKDAELQTFAKTNKIKDADKLSRIGLIDQIYKKLIRPTLIDPVFLHGYPTELQPLARQQDKNPMIVDQFQLVINGWEMLKAYNELIDPVIQRERFAEQAKRKQGGQDETMEIDDEYIEAMSYGMPPMSGWGMGVDRFVALLLGKVNLRDVVFFPLVRPSKK
ncbi:MAG: lysine--tRNA ligase [bacterium]|nr:lysine--tRNA ligase [bacterium]